jgi:hypothetical protein
MTKERGDGISTTVSTIYQSKAKTKAIETCPTRGRSVVYHGRHSSIRQTGSGDDDDDGGLHFAQQTNPSLRKQGHAQAAELNLKSTAPRLASPSSLLVPRALPPHATSNHRTREA